MRMVNFTGHGMERFRERLPKGVDNPDQLEKFLKDNTLRAYKSGYDEAVYLITDEGGKRVWVFTWDKYLRTVMEKDNYITIRVMLKHGAKLWNRDEALDYLFG